MRTYDYGNVTIVVHRPALDAKEQEHRETALRQAVAQYGKALAKGGK